MGANMFGRPVVIRSFGDVSATGSPCDGPDCFSSQGWTDPRTRANFRRGGRRNRITMNEETIRQQKELLNRFFGLANEITSELSSRDKENSEDAFRQQQEWVNRAFNIAQDVASGASSPRYEIDDTEDMFQVVLDVPGVPASTIQVSVVEEKDGQQVLSVQGERQVRGRSRGSDKDESSSSSRTAKFNKTFSLDSTVDPDKITAQLNNGVLLISAPKFPKEEKTKKIPVNVVQANENVDEVTVDVVSEDKEESTQEKDSDADDSNKNSEQ